MREPSAIVAVHTTCIARRDQQHTAKRDSLPQLAGVTHDEMDHRDRDEHRREGEEHLRDRKHHLLEVALIVRRADERGRLAKERVDARIAHHAVDLARDDRRAHHDLAARRHAHRQRLASQSRLIDLDLHAVTHDAVGRHAETGGERDTIARHQQRGVNLAPAAIPLHSSLRLERSFQRRNGISRPHVLPEANKAVEEQQRRQRVKVGPLFQEVLDKARQDDHARHEASEVRQEDHVPWRGVVWQLVKPKLFQPDLSLGLVQAFLTRRIDMCTWLSGQIEHGGLVMEGAGRLFHGFSSAKTTVAGTKLRAALF